MATAPDRIALAHPDRRCGLPPYLESKTILLAGEPAKLAP
ncbi:hypothetical protein NX02_19175 [Sphingomonas sanxanigenens DSM 19645 = NX02]|uniref:Uncharacterized protein n=1 Tax=Sphingomonas sanxanigenens DSM 19645 = NX02 TaxID=1123269 RepID=W0AC93_9SPHN|nr:hypothetical protein NX02_19175 [Sphingomonas sanxanigenens DSM 19645 = NX02]